MAKKNKTVFAVCFPEYMYGYFDPRCGEPLLFKSVDDAMEGAVPNARFARYVLDCEGTIVGSKYEFVPKTTKKAKK